ncbi:ABC transporter ATP-binding protein [Apilactobacillus micheneri]|uniref:ABC transporter ATP-binding protein n=1 Tax=Apilactobacillus micheneri TaxID=1899430 RepID=A0A9Q8INL9_9LACO|nr:ABC transporter ATP-binding protein [Apilactobacillus micheneri]TPR40977.1 ABC transporter ATP-binding protein [Apilactobacillus micheneri]TPR46084.1 ABC transporter ATP-binding protein [Apilactobacillus micheneri]TPR46769.1 ABC transporter ATP-binding protein [Apilactobacillus micheneri]
MATLTIKNLKFNYAKNKIPIFNDVNLHFAPKTLSIIHGPSGCGKSTLLKIIARLYPKYSEGITSGKIFLNQRDINLINELSFRKQIAMMFQNPNQQFCMQNGYDELIFTMENLQLPNDKISKKINEAIQFGNISNIIHHPFDTLSGGEKQRVALSIIYAINPNIILLDEPFASVDYETRKILIGKLDQLKHMGKTIIIVDHDLSLYEKTFDNLIIYNNNNFKSISYKASIRKFEEFQISPAIKCSIPNNQPITLELQNISINNGDKKLIQNNSINFYQGYTTLITGKNGSGKTSLFNTLIKLHPFNGEVIFNQKNIRKIRTAKYYKDIGIIFQDSDKQFIKLTVKEEIQLSIKKHNHKLFSTIEIDNFIKNLGLESLLDQVVYSLSEGQQKKLQILSMLIMGHSVLLLDEPFKGVDLKSIKVINDMIKLAKKRGQTQIIISHQRYELKELIDFHITLSNRNLEYKESF